MDSVKATFYWLKALVEEDGQPSLTRSAFACSLILQIVVTIWHCIAPGIIDQHVTNMFNNTLLFIAGIWGIRGIANDAIEKIIQAIEARK